MDNTGENTALVPSTGTTARPSNTYHSLNNPRRIPDFDDGPTAQLQGMGQPISDQALRYEKAHTVTRRHWVVLLLACLLLFGNYYSYDTPAALNVQLREWLGTDYATHQFHLNLLYSVYSFPNIILPLLGGVLIDRLSVSLMLVIFSVLICVGTAIFAIGVSFKAIWVMILGRLVFGIGGECLEVAQAKITTDWFRNRWLGFALGLNLSSARIASALNDNISPWIARKSGLGVAGAAWVGFIICGFSLGCGCALAYLDRPESRTVAGVRLDARDREKLQDSNERIIGRQAINYSTDSAFTLSSEAMEEEVALENEQEMTEDDQMHWSEIFDLQTTFWILALCSVLLYGMLFAPCISLPLKRPAKL
ncbi:hypothetical protein BGW38_010118 [Lunasporangiospora selenospora]|uniref:Lysosomal dipeptide transporter MFSD1 n=1 Tax=Lunasporangiospora selenospora TaxID=979761 RepID=A0A9P6KFM8_9FUNG|nr:hypothetical protein BGW38_010118 [Lunasporangiospora selenospora]